MNDRNYRNLTLIVGPTGSGKSILISELLKTAEIYKVIPSTTRACKHNEVEGKDYYFITWEEFRSLVENDQMISSFESEGNYYGVTYEEFERAMDKGLPVLWEITLDEALKIKMRYPNVKTVLVIAPLDVIRRRLEQKGIRAESLINSKLIEAKLILDEAQRLDHIIVVEEDKFDKAAAQLKEIVFTSS